jgi:hypothetical protein
MKAKCQKKYPEFTNEVDSLTADQLKARIVGLQQALQESDNAKEADEGLQLAKDQAREFAAPYNDVRKAVKLKTQYILELLSEKGK